MNSPSANPDYVDRSKSDIEIIRLWPTVFIIQKLPDHEASTGRLTSLATARSEDGVFTIDDPGVHWLKSHIAHAVGAYLQQAGFTRSLPWSARAHFAIQEFGLQRALANQPGSYLAGMYVLQWPTDHSQSRDDALPGCVSFYDPRSGMNMNAIKRDPYINYHRTIRPVPGLLVLWPAFVNYFVHPNLSAERAMRVDFDIQFQPSVGCDA